MSQSDDKVLKTANHYGYFMVLAIKLCKKMYVGYIKSKKTNNYDSRIKMSKFQVPKLNSFYRKIIYKT